MHCKELESVLETEGLVELSKDARLHLATCGACQGLVADLDSIVTAAKSLPAEVNPPDRIWISLRAQLEAEGLIKEPVEVSGRPSWRDSFRVWLNARSFAIVTAAALVLAASLYVTRTPRNNNAGSGKNQPMAETPRAAQPQVTASAPPVSTAPANSSPSHALVAPSKTKDLAPSPSESASFALNEAELDVSSMQLAGENAQVDASLRQNLRTLNAFIAECEQHLKQNPQDELAREYLNTAYQQKADLLAAMMESGRGDN
jgi:hypothetical protein